MTAAATAQRITSGPIDPDLEAIIPELARKARRLRQIESIIRLPESQFSRRSAMLVERSGYFDDFTAAAERLKIPGDRPGRALLLIVEEADRLFGGRGRKPTLAQVLTGLRAVTAVAERDLSTAESDVFEARTREREARALVAACTGSVTYLELSSRG